MTSSRAHVHWICRGRFATWWLGAVVLWAVSMATVPAGAGEWSGSVSIEGRLFGDSGLDGQADSNLSLALEPEYYLAWDDDDQTLRFTPFLRIDGEDDERTHFDIRELYWQRVGRRWEVSVGMKKVFWGVAESVHLVDIVNQTDLVEDLDGEQKLGQPMVHLAWIERWGTLDLFLLPGFRERTFPGVDGRFRTQPPVDTDRPLYASSAGDDHVDWAVRWSHSVGAFDLGVSHFSGTSREPAFVEDPASTDPTSTDRFLPFYGQMDQTGLDVQATLGSWLLKLEAIHRTFDGGDVQAAVAGFEYTLFDLARTGLDLGLLLEYYGGEVGGPAPEGTSQVFEVDNIFVGTRLALNDPQGTELLIGTGIETRDGSTFLNIEGSRRLGNAWRLTLRGRGFVDIAEDNFLLAPLRQDDYLELGLAYYF